MNDPSCELSTPPLRRGFAAALLDALHESRRRQAVREIHDHRHLIDETKTREFSRAVERSPGGHSHPQNRHSASQQMSMNAKLLIAAVLLGFAIIHAFGAMRTLAGTQSDRSPAETAHMYRAD